MRSGFCRVAERTVLGATFWDQRFLDVTRLRNIPAVEQRLPDIALNEAFMVFGAFGLAFNIIVR